jgi:hypothetical protein
MELIHKKQMVKFSRYSLAPKKKSFTSTERLFSQVTLFDVMRNISTLEALKNYTLNARKNAFTMVNEEKKYTVLEPDFWLSWNSPPSTHYLFTSRHIVLLFAQPIMSLHPSLMSRGQLWRGLVPKYIGLCM